MAETILTLEFEDEALVYIDAYKKNSDVFGQTHVIALSVAVQLVLKSHGVPYNNTLSYFNNQAHARAIIRSEEWLQLIESHTDLNDALRAELSFCIRPVFNYLLWLAEIITQAEEIVQPTRLCYISRVTPDHDHDWKLTPRDRPLGSILEAYAKQKGLEYKAFSPSAAGQEQLHTNQEVPTSDLGFCSSIVSRLLAQCAQRLTAGRHTVLLAADSYGLGKAARQLDDDLPGLIYMVLDPATSSTSVRHLIVLFRNLFRSVTRPTGSSSFIKLPMWAFPYDRQQAGRQAEQVNKNVEELANRIEGVWHDKFEHRNLDLVPFIARKLRGGIKHYLVTLAQAQSPLHAALEAVRPRLVLSPYCTDVYNLLGDICRELDIPAIMVTHGTHVPPRNRVEKIEQWRLSQSLMLAPTYELTAAQSPWAFRHAVYYGAGRRALKTGPLLFARTDSSQGQHLRWRLGIARVMAVIVYAVTQKKRSSVRFHVFETEDEYLASMSDLVLAVNQIKDAHLVLKLHPASDFSEEDMRSLLPPCERMSVLHRESFGEVLSVADLLVSYSSTTIEEAILNHIPVVLYDRWRRYCHIEAFDCDTEDSERWQASAVYYTSELDRLPLVLKHALRQVKTTRYSNHLFQNGEAHPISYHVKNLLIKHWKGESL